MVITLPPSSIVAPPGYTLARVTERKPALAAEACNTPPLKFTIPEPFTVVPETSPPFRFKIPVLTVRK